MNRWTGLRAFFSGLVDTAWLRHANPWSVYTRFAAIPAGIVAIWSRAWIGEWSALPIAVVVLWLILNPIAFSPVHTPTHWISKGIYGERLWLRGAVKTRRRRYMLNGLAVAGALGLLIVAWGLANFNVLACCVGALLTVVAQLVRIANFATIYDENVRDENIRDDKNPGTARSAPPTRRPSSFDARCGGP